MELSFAKKGFREKTTDVIMNGTVTIGSHSYTSNWVVSDCNNDVMLGMPWHVEMKPQVDYKGRTVTVNGDLLMPKALKNIPVARSTKVKVESMGVKKFRKLLRKGGSDMEVYQLVAREVKKVKQGDGIEDMVSDPMMKRILRKHRNMFRDDLPAGLPPNRTVDHEITVDEGEKPPHRRMFQLSPGELRAAKEYVDSLIATGKIRPSKSPYGAPLFFVKEKDGRLRGVVDYRALNRITKKNSSPLPRSDEMFDRLGEATVFTRMDLKTGFHQIRVKPGDIEKTAFNTKYGQFEYLVLPMGLCNAPATFQSLMNEVFHDCLDDFLVVYMDDLLIFSRDASSHYRHVETVLTRLEEHELYVAPKKCEFMKEEIEFLGLVVGKNGIKVDPRKVEILKTWPKPDSITDIRSFLGLLQFFRRFIPKFSQIAAPLTNLTKKGSGVHDWDETCDEAFSKLKRLITEAPILIAPDWSKPFRGHVDASQTAVGGTLTQLDESGRDRVIAFFSKKLCDAEKNYTANDRELLGLVKFLERFRCYLEGSTFEIFTDNQVLKYFFTKPKLSRREARWLEAFGNFGIFPINLKPGKIHVLGDVLSRAPHAEDAGACVNDVEIPFIRFEDVISGYEEDQFFGPVVEALLDKWPEDAIEKLKLEKMLPMFRLDGKRLLYNGKVCVPRRCVATVLGIAHDARVGGHFKFAKTLSRLANFHWRHKARDVKNYVSGCLTCQQYKDSNQKKLTEPASLEMPDRRWGSLATDFIVRLPKTKEGYDAITTWVDRLTRRVHFVRCKTSDNAVDVANAFFANIFKLHGLPDSIVSDRDSKFTSEFWKRLMKLAGVQLKMSSSRHPQTDGASEIMNRMVENYLRCYCSYHQDDWDEMLPAAEFAYNSAVSEDLGMSPFELDLGWNPRSPLDFIAGSEVPVQSVNELKQRLKTSLQDAQFSYKVSKARQAAEASKRYKTPEYTVGSKVWINKSLFTDAYTKSQESDKLSAKRYGPFVVKELVGRNAVRLELPSHFRIHPVIHVSHTIPFVQQPSDIAQPVEPRPEPVPTVEGEEHIVDKILRHKKSGRGFRFLTLMKGDPIHDAWWQPTSDFVDTDGTVNDVWHKYIVENDIMHKYH